MTNPYILIVDDDVSILRLVSDILGDEGYDTRMAENGAAALSLIGDAPPVLVILDMRMPVMDGWTFASRFREQAAEVPILVMTAARDAQRWAAEIEAAGYIAKPFDVDHVLDEVLRLAGPPSQPRSGTLQNARPRLSLRAFFRQFTRRTWQRGLA